MKHLFLFFLFVITSTTVSAQTEPRIRRGDVQLGGNLDLSVATSDYSTNSQANPSSVSTFGFGVSPAFFLANRFALGLGFNYKGTSNYYSQQTDIIAAPFLRYYIRLGQKVSLYPELGIGFASNSYSTLNNFSNSAYQTRGNATGLGGNVGLGLAVFLNDHIALDFQTRFNSSIVNGIYSTNYNYSPITGDYKLQKTALGLYAGFQVFLGK